MDATFRFFEPFIKLYFVDEELYSLGLSEFIGDVG